MPPAYELGFESLDEELGDLALDVDGDLPAWLDGALLRNGPAKFEAGGEPVAHWFDGLGMLRKFAFSGGELRYSNRFLRSEEYRSVVEEGAVGAGQFGTGPTGGLLDRLKAAVVPRPTDNANVNVMRVGGAFVAVTETPLGVRFDPATLETRGRWEYDDAVSGQLTTAHPHYDARRGEYVNYVTEFGRTNRYRVYRLPDGATERQPVGSVAVEEPAYMHSFALTPGYVVLAEFPFTVSPWRLLLPTGGSFVDAYEWHPERGTRFLVLDRATGEVVAEPVGEPLFAFHHVNAFERDGDLLVDLVAFEDPSPIEALYLADLRSGEFSQPMGELRRYRLSPGGRTAGGRDGGAWTVERAGTFADGMSLPRASPAVETREYRYAYGQAQPGGPVTSFPTGLQKVDVATGQVRTWRDDDAYAGEPVFVPRPGGDAEDDGVVLSVLLDADRGQSALVVLDGETFAEEARAWLPHVLPFDFHGRFFPGVE